MKRNSIEKPNLPAEVFLFVCKIFLIIVLANNLVWCAAVFSGGTHNHVQITQDGHDNTQKIQDAIKE